MTDDNFLPIDKLMEFGMGLAVARQMGQSMNHAMNQMQIPGVMSPPPATARGSYYALLDGQQTGPLSEQDLPDLIAKGRIVQETYIWRAGMPKWDLARHLPELAGLLAALPPQLNATSVP